MASLFDNPDEESSFVAELQKRQARAGTAPGKQSGKGGLLTSLISEGGAIGGGAAGAAIGSVVPVVGTAIGGIIGAGLGAFGGRLAENKIRDNEYRVGDAAKEGALSAVLAGPLKLGKYATTGVKAGVAGKGLTSALTEGAEAATKFSVKGAVGNKLVQGADDVAVKSFKFTPSQLTKFNKKYGEDVTGVIKRNNLIGSTPDDFAEAITKQQGRFDELVTTAGTVKKDQVEKTLRASYNKLMKSAPADTKAMGKKVKAEVDTLLEGMGDEISASDLNVMRRQFDDLVNYSNQLADPARYGVNKRIADGLRKTIQKASGSDELKNTGLEISKLRQIQDAVLMQSNRGRGANPLSLTSLLAGGVGGGVSGPGGALAAGAGAKIVNSPTMLKAASKTLENAGEKLVAGAPGAVRGTVEGIGRGVVGESLVSSLTQSPTMNPNTMPNMNNPTSDNMYSMPELSAPQPEMSTEQSPYTREALMMDIQRDPQNTNEYIKYYEQLQEIYAPQAPAVELSQSSKNAMASSDNAINTIDQLEQLFTNAGSGSGRIGGTLKGLAANAGFDENAKIYNSLSQASVTQIAKALAGSGSGTVSDMDAKVIIAALPTIRDTPAEARAKFNALRQRLETARNNTMLYGAGDIPATDTSLQGALLR